MPPRIDLSGGKVYTAAGARLYSEIGSGAYAKVYRCYANERHLAAKLYQDPAHINHAENETRILAELSSDNSPFFPRGFGLLRPRIEGTSYPLVLMSLCKYRDGCEGLTLREAIDGRRRNGEAMAVSELQTEASARQFAYGLVQAVQLLHKHDVIHGDLKPDNVLIDMQGDGDAPRPVLCDFNVSGEEKRGRDGLSRRYVPPEVLSGERAVLRRSDDLYALALTIWEMHSGLGRRPDDSEGCPTGPCPPWTAALKAVVVRCVQPDEGARLVDVDAGLAELLRLLSPFYTESAEKDAPPPIAADEETWARERWASLRGRFESWSEGADDLFTPKEISVRVRTAVSSLRSEDTALAGIEREIESMGPICLPALFRASHVINDHGTGFTRAEALATSLARRDRGIARACVDAYLLSSSRAARTLARSLIGILGEFDDEWFDGVNAESALLDDAEREDIAAAAISYSTSESSIRRSLALVSERYMKSPARNYESLRLRMSPCFANAALATIGSIVHRYAVHGSWASMVEYQNSRDRRGLDFGILELLGDFFATRPAEFELLFSAHDLSDAHERFVWRVFARKAARQHGSVRDRLRVSAEGGSAHAALVLQDLQSRSSETTASVEQLVPAVLRGDAAWRALRDLPDRDVAVALAAFHEHSVDALWRAIQAIGARPRARTTIVQHLLRNWERAATTDYEQLVRVAVKWPLDLIRNELRERLTSDLAHPDREPDARRGLRVLLEG